MSSQIYHRLHIPEPCHEDWSKMTPNEKGAFCRSCSKSVHDFTTKSEEQVASIISEGAAKGEKMCGRFYRWQLGATPDIIIPVSALPRMLSPVRAFAASVFIVFGTMLFNITNANGQTVEQVKLFPDTNLTTGPEGTKKLKQGFQDSLKVDWENLQDKELLWGDVDYSKEDTIDLQQVNDTLAADSSVIQFTDTFRVDFKWEWMPVEVMGASIIVCEPDSFVMYGDVWVAGAIGTLPEADQPSQLPIDEKPAPQDKDSLTITSSERLPVRPLPPPPGKKNDANTFFEPVIDGGDDDLICYPNPSTGPVTINYVIDKLCDARLELYDLSGQRLRTMFDIKGHHHGIYHTSYDLSDLPAGTYVFRLHTGDKVMNTRVVITR